MGFEDDLKARRADIEAEIAGLKARVAQLEVVLSSFDDIIRFYDPSAAVAGPAAPKGERAALRLPTQLQRLNKTDAVCDMLREAGRPISTGDCAASIGQST